MCGRVNEIQDPNSLLYDLSETRYGSVDKSFRKCCYDYACGMITIYFSSTFY